MLVSLLFILLTSIFQSISDGEELLQGIFAGTCIVLYTVFHSKLILFLTANEVSFIC